ncbi:unnamed protein product [Rotaria sordida]|uniref:Serine/threonine-protein phosphatase n=4 Tax=Rotaria sordida TaxID=392033 RepID=A0A814LLM1_9BILA|nr:unnamed protein product [Rotaria sordida]
MPCKRINDSLRALLIHYAASVWEVELKIREEFFSNSFPSDWMSSDTDLNTDVENTGTEEHNFHFPSVPDINKLFEKFRPRSDQIDFEGFVNTILRKEYRGTSRLLLLDGDMANWFSSNESRRQVDNRSPAPVPEKIQHELANHFVTLKRTGQLFQGKALLVLDSYQTTHSSSSRIALENLPRSLSTEIFNKETNAKIIQDLLRGFNKSSPWTTEQYKRLPPFIIGLCQDVKTIFHGEARCLKLSSPTYILGDLHGNYEDLIGYEQLFWRATPFLTPASFLFLGDYVDRGKHGLEVVLYLFAMKYLCPKKVFLLRGNHEVRNVQKAFTFHRECILRFQETEGNKVWETINSVFDVLPLAAVIDDQILCVHGGIPSPTSCPGDFISTVNRIPIPLYAPEKQSDLAWQLMWNDPKSGDTSDCCGVRPEMIRDKQHPSYWTNTKYCPKHIHLENSESVHSSTDKDDNDIVDCNVSRTDRYSSRQTSYGIILTMYNCGIIIKFDELYRSQSPIQVLHHLFTTIDCLSPVVSLPKYLIYDNAGGLLLTFRNRLQNEIPSRATAQHVTPLSTTNNETITIANGDVNLSCIYFKEEEEEYTPPD